MIMSEWKEVRLGDLCYKVCSGGTPKSTCSSYYEGGTIPWLNTKEINYNRIFETESHITEDGLNNSSAKWIDSNAVVVAMYGATAGRVAIAKVPMTTNQACCNLMIDSSKADYNFIYYYLSNSYKYLLSMANGAAQQNLNAQIIKDLFISLPPLTEQHRIASILSSLDSKIENNRKICANLEAQAQALFKHWFIDFAPFKDGKFVESELGMIPEGWRVGSILDIAELYDYQRKPLSSMEREDMKGDYPYYGATSIMDYIDKYIFDGTYVLMGEDGSVVKDNGCPYLQYVWGKFWPNNHAHVMQGKNGFSTEMLYCFLSKTDVRSIVTGAVQMKISQRSMSHLLTVIPSKSVCGDYNRIIRPLFDLIKSTKEENDRLSTLRDTLLPKLMSGEIKV